MELADETHSAPVNIVGIPAILLDGSSCRVARLVGPESLMPRYAHPYKSGIRPARGLDNLTMTRAESATLASACRARCGSNGFGEQIAQHFKKRLANAKAALEGEGHV